MPVDNWSIFGIVLQKGKKQVPPYMGGILRLSGDM